MSRVIRHEADVQINGEAQRVLTIDEPSVTEPTPPDGEDRYTIKIRAADALVMHSIVQTVIAHVEEIVRGAEALAKPTAAK